MAHHSMKLLVCVLIPASPVYLDKYLSSTTFRYYHVRSVILQYEFVGPLAFVVGGEGLGGLREENTYLIG